ncbi:MAG: hypothetical protein ACLTWR_08960 [Agathobaculum desmolans]|uniref:hypothetical protein n=1 Tax=Agathobaculum desmolans TaxID=39484 RepID=UPI003992E3AC
MPNLSLESETLLLDLYCQYRKRVKQKLPRHEAAIFSNHSSHTLFEDDFLNGFMDLSGELAAKQYITCEPSTITLTPSGIAFAQNLLQSELVFEAAKNARREARLSLFLAAVSCTGTIVAAAVALIAFILAR